MPTRSRLTPRRNDQERRSTTPSFSELEQNLRIDQNQLERECVYQPELYYQIASHRANMMSFRDATKLAVEETKATVEAEVRRHAEVSGERITVSEVDAAKATDQRVRNVSAKLLEANEDLAKAEALREAFQQRKDMLRELVALYLSNYYGDPARGAESRVRDVATEGLKRARREQQQNRRD